MHTQVGNQSTAIPFPSAANQRGRQKRKPKAPHRKETSLRPSMTDAPVPVGDNGWLTYREAACLLATTSGTLMTWICVGRYSIPHYKIGRSVRFRRSELVEWLASRKRGGVEAPR
jgi:excisionase family DNA binding protein